jgi:hypothetical protein
MFAFILGGTYALTTFMTTGIEIRDKKQGRGLNSVSERKFNLEEEHKDIIASLDLDNFSLSRIPRPQDEKASVVEEKRKT